MNIHFIWNRDKKAPVVLAAIKALYNWKQNIGSVRIIAHATDNKVGEVFTYFGEFVDEIKTFPEDLKTTLQVDRLWFDLETTYVAKTLEEPGIVLLNTSYAFPTAQYVFSDKYIVLGSKVRTNQYATKYYSRITGGTLLQTGEKELPDPAGFYYFPDPIIGNVWAGVGLRIQQDVSMHVRTTRASWVGEVPTWGSCLPHTSQEVLYYLLATKLGYPIDSINRGEGWKVFYRGEDMIDTGVIDLPQKVYQPVLDYSEFLDWTNSGKLKEKLLG